MHGVILSGLKRYVDAKFGARTWTKIRTEAGMPDILYVAISQYADQDALRLLAAGAKATGRSPADFQEDFGAFLAEDLVRMYAAMIDPSWRTLDIIERVQTTVHKVVRDKVPHARLPDFSAVRQGPDAVLLTYTSWRRLCALAKGIARGLAAHFGEKLEISEGTCQLKNASACRISFKRVT